MSNLLQVVETAEFADSPYGLFSLQDPNVPADEHWVGGFTFENRQCSLTQNYLDVCGGGPAPIAGVTPSGDAIQTFLPYVVEAVETCSTFGFVARDLEDRARDALEAITQKAVEKELWTGAVATANSYTNNRFLADSTSTDVTPTPGTAVKVRYGLALLEQALAECGAGTRGVIHMTRDVASTLPLHRNGDRLETQLGNYVVAGTGYTGSGPTGVVPATGTWMYATGPVAVTLGDIQILGATKAEQVTRETNTWQVRAIRPAAAVWDGCCAFAVYVDLALDYA